MILIKNPGKVKCSLKGYVEFQIAHVQQLSIHEPTEGATAQIIPALLVFVILTLEYG